MLTTNFGFGSTALYFCFDHSQIWGHFCTFWAFRGYFWGWGQVQNVFGTYLPRLTTFLRPAILDFESASTYYVF